MPNEKEIKCENCQLEISMETTNYEKQCPTCKHEGCYKCIDSHNCPTPTDDKDWRSRWDKEFPTRIMNEDNPQYVLGWNAAKWRAQQILENELAQAVKRERERIRAEVRLGMARWVAMIVKNEFLQLGEHDIKTGVYGWVSEQEIEASIMSYIRGDDQLTEDKS